MDESAHPPQAPSRGSARRLLGRLHITGIFWYRFHHWGVAFMPRWCVGPFILLFTSFFFLALRKIRFAIARNLEAVLGPCGWWQRQVRIYRTMWNFAWCLSERYERLSTDRSLSLTMSGEHHWKSVLSGTAGFIMVTAHLGNWEVGSFISADRHERNVHVVREQEMDPVAQRFVEELLESQSEPNYRTHFVDREEQLGVTLLHALRAGEMVALQGDRPRTAGRTLPVCLFGRSVLFPEGPVALARAADVKLLPVFVLREGRLRYRAAFRRPISVPRTADRTADLTAAVRRVAIEVEWAIREEPYQWFCFADLWAVGATDPTQPEAPASPLP